MKFNLSSYQNPSEENQLLWQIFATKVAEVYVTTVAVEANRGRLVEKLGETGRWMSSMSDGKILTL